MSQVCINSSSKASLFRRNGEHLSTTSSGFALLLCKFSFRANSCLSARPFRVFRVFRGSDSHRLPEKPSFCHSFFCHHSVLSQKTNFKLFCHWTAFVPPPVL